MSCLQFTVFLFFFMWKDSRISILCDLISTSRIMELSKLNSCLSFAWSCEAVLIFSYGCERQPKCFWWSLFFHPWLFRFCPDDSISREISKIRPAGSSIVLQQSPSLNKYDEITIDVIFDNSFLCIFVSSLNNNSRWIIMQVKLGNISRSMKGMDLQPNIYIVKSYKHSENIINLATHLKHKPAAKLSNSIDTSRIRKLKMNSNVHDIYQIKIQ